MGPDRTEPVGIADVVEYLRAGLSLPLAGSLVVDIGAGAMTFRDMLLGAAERWGSGAGSSASRSFPRDCLPTGYPDHSRSVPDRPRLVEA